MSEKTNLRAIYFIIFAFFFGHLIYLNTPFVNLEWIYRVGSEYYNTGDSYFRDFYLNNQANPITYSFLSSFFVYIFGDHFISYRLLSLIGGSLILVSLINYKSPFLLLIVALNPLIWVYSGRAYSELLSVGLLVLAIELHKNGYLKGLFAGLSASIKYHSILFAGPYWGLKWIENSIEEKRLNLKNINFISGFLAATLFLLFLFSYDYFYDVWVVPDKFKETLGINLPKFLDNFFGYGFYLSALFCITVPFLLINTKFKFHIIALLISVPIAMINQNNGEMNFGSLDQLIGSELILLIKIIGFWNFLLCVNFFVRHKESRIMTITILFYILLLSATRPAQRYLLFIIPFWSILIVQSNILIVQSYVKLFALFKWGYVALLFMVAVFSSVYQVANAKTSKDIVLWAQKENLMINTYEIYAHVGDSCMHSGESDISVEIRSYMRESDVVLFTKAVNIFGFEMKRYFVVKNIEKRNKAKPMDLKLCKK